MAFPALTCVRGDRLMAQYDIFSNPSDSAADDIPYVVVIQSDLLDALATRLTMPLAALDIAIKVPSRCARSSWSRGNACMLWRTTPRLGRPDS
jgi:hypothetical protein